MRFAHDHPRPLAPVRRQPKGAALVEFALVALFLMTISAGAFDMGMAWRVGLVTNEAARTGARTGSGLGTNYLADWYALSGARAALKNSNRLNDVQRVVIYRSDAVNGQVPSICTTATSGVTDACNIITGSQFRGMTDSSFNTTTGCFTAATVKNWCPSSRNSVQLTAEYYGIWIQVRYTYTFKMLGSSTNVNRDAVMRLEPAVS